VSGRTRNRPPLSPQEAWLSDGRQVLHFRPSRWDRWSQQLEVTVGELLPDQPVPLLKRRWELSREEALRLWSEKRREGWQVCQQPGGLLSVFALMKDALDQLSLEQTWLLADTVHGENAACASHGSTY